MSDMADIQDAYSRLYRLRERYRHEAASLDPNERAALRKVFENDRFIEGMGKVRAISDHVEKGLTVLRHTDNSPFSVRRRCFCGSLRLPDRHGRSPPTD